MAITGACEVRDNLLLTGITITPWAWTVKPGGPNRTIGCLCVEVVATDDGGDDS
jgi:hypothetical protein